MPEGAAARSARIAVLVSGQGRNLQALIQACADGRIPGHIVGVLSNRTDAPALRRAADAGLLTLALPHGAFPDRAAFDAALAEAVDAWSPDIVVLAGFMRVLGAPFVQRFAGRLINIHPSLLPRHPGLDTHRRALDAGDTEHGATVHYVTEALDGGPPIIQGRVSVRTEDDVDQLAERVMNQVEIHIFPQVVAWMARGELRLRGARAEWRGAPLDAPLGMDTLEVAFR